MRISVPSAVAVTILSLLLDPAFSWGDLGHRTVGYLSTKYMTSNGLAFVNHLIQPNDSFDISDGAVWADRIKRKRPNTKEWHFIDAQDNPPTECKVNYNRDCAGRDGCIVSAILNMTSRLGDSDLPDKQHQEAVKFLLHFLGDIHQPLHTEAEERGGTQTPIIWKGHSGDKWNLHAVWDTYILQEITGFNPPKKDPGEEEEKAAALQWSEELFEEQGGDPSDECVPNSGDKAKNLRCVLKWASESNAEICKYVLNPDPQDQELFPKYAKGAEPIVKDMIGRAARRFANIVNSMAESPVMVDREERRQIDL